MSPFSDTFPTANPIQAEREGIDTNAFVTKLTPAGSALAYSTYLGGTSCCEGNGGFEEGRGIDVDDAGGAYVTGVTSSDDFPLVDPIQSRPQGFFNFFDAFVAHVNPAGSALVYSTYLGGSDVEGAGGGADEGNGIAVDGAGNAYVTGETSSENFPTVNAFQPDLSAGSLGAAFVAKITQAASPPTTTTVPTTTTSTVPTTTTTTPAPGGDPIHLDCTVLSNGDVVRVTGTISCDDGRRFRIQVTVAQEESFGQRLRTGRCTGQPQRFTVPVAANSGSPFQEGSAQVDAIAQIGVPGARTIEHTFSSSSEVTIDIPGRFMGQVVTAFLAMERFER